MGTVAQVAAAAGAYAIVALLAWVAPKVLRSASPVVVGIATAAAVAGALAADGAATGRDAYDAGVRVLVGVGFVAAGCYSTAKPRLAASALVVVASLLGSGAAWPVSVAFGASLALVLLRTDGPAIGALVGLALGQAALRLDWPEATAMSLLLGLVAFAVVVGSALAHVHGRTRRRVAVGAIGVGVLLAAVGGAWALAALSVRGELTDAVEVARRGLDAAREGRTAAAARRFAEARRGFAHAEDRLNGWWARGVAAVPGVAQNADALRVMTRAGRELAAAGAETARRADPDAITPVDGAVPLDEVRALAAPLATASDALAGARAELASIRSPWVAPFLTDRVRTLDRKLARGARDTASARLAVSVVPRLLGGDGERRYLLVFQTPAEQRANGGVIGNVAELTYRDGVIELARNVRDVDVNQGGSGQERTLVGPEDYVRRYAAYHPESVIQNVTLSPDFPSIATVLEGVYPQSGGAPVDGVISLDPVALGEFLRLTGDVPVPGFDVVLTADNAADVLLREQYQRFPDDTERASFLTAAVAATFDRLRATSLPGPTRVGEILGPMVRQGRLQLHSRDPEEQRFFRRIGADGAVPAIGRGDAFGLVTQNSAGNKIDGFQRRVVRYSAQVDPATGDVDAMASITVRNRAPASGLPDIVIGSFPDSPLPRGTSRVVLSVYSPLALQSATIDGQSAAFLEDTELGRNVYTVQLEIPPGGRRDLELALEGRVTLGSGRRYRLRMWHQATVVPDRARIAVRPVAGWAVVGPRGLRVTDRGAVRRSLVAEPITVSTGFAED